MSFLAKYWNVVERAVTETGMNPGDVKVDIHELLKNTDVVNTVVPPETPETQTPETPAEAGHMPEPPDEVIDEMTRGSARPVDGFEELEVKATRSRTAKTKADKKSRMGDGMGEPNSRRSTNGGKKTKATKSIRKQLKKIGGGRKVNVVLEEVVLDGGTVWSASG